MKKILFILLLWPFLSPAQSILPRFENDTLYTSGGYKIYKGRVLLLGKGTSAAGYFSHIKFHYSTNRTDTYILQNSTVLVNKLKNYKYTGPDNSSIRIAGTATLKDGAKMEVDFIMNFERVMEDYAGQAAELIVPEEYKNKVIQTTATEIKKTKPADELKKQVPPEDIRKLLVADEIRKLFDLYKEGALSKEEYEVQKKKLLERQ
jgi:hypothetical protein